MGVDRTLAHQGAVQDARPYGVPPGAVPYNSGMRSQPTRETVPYISDTPYVVPYADRPNCAGNRTDGKPCGAKAQPGLRMCASHEDQE